MKRSGFTLFEVLIALMVVVILISTMSETISTAFKSKERAEWAIDGVRDTQTVGDVWVSTAACAVPPNPLFAGADSIAAGITVGSSYLFGPFKGDNASMSFYTTGPEPEVTIQGDVRHVAFGLAAQADDRLALVESADPNPPAQEVNTQLPQEILVTGVRAVSFQYYDGAGWRDAWDSTSADMNNTLPYAVKMTLTLEPVRADGPERVLTRFATIWCADKTVNDSTNAVAALRVAADETTITDTTGGG